MVRGTLFITNGGTKKTLFGLERVAEQKKTMELCCSLCSLQLGLD